MLRSCCVFILWFMRLKTTVSFGGYRPTRCSIVFSQLNTVPRSRSGQGFLQGVNLSPLVCVASDGDYLSSRIKSWLDAEYIPQEIHSKLGQKVQGEYKKLRDAGISDLGEVLVGLGASLETFDMENAFVNGWDVANFASELLIRRLDKQVNHTDLDARLDDTLTMESGLRMLSSGFERYRILQRYLEGETPYQDLHSMLGVLLGFRRVQTPQGVRFLQQPHLAPLRWEALEKVPYFEDTDDDELGRRLAADLPGDAGSVDVVMESLVGMELYAELKNSTEPAVQRRVLVAKWVYIQGFLNNDFPAQERYVPAHLQREVEDTH